jgi:meiosis induction protein kinase IME2/SME1
MNAVDFPPDFYNPPKEIPLQTYLSKYKSIGSLGNGSFGAVELTKYRLNKDDLCKVQKSKIGTMLDPLKDSKLNVNNLVAIKTMKRRLPLLNDYLRVKEIRFILSIPSHSCLVQIYEMFIDDVNFQLHISMESMNQNLYQLIKSRKNILFSPVTLRSILSQVLSAIRHIHKHDYYHRDVKPENILVVPTCLYYGNKDSVPPYRKNDNFVVKLADYGLARHIHNLKPYTAYVSTRWYRSPEILLRQKWYSKPIDMWAFGAVATEVANFSPLFPGTNELDQIWRIFNTLGYPGVPQIDGSTLFPLGGYWKDAQILAAKLNFAFPPEPGLQMYDILPDPIHSELATVVKACLSWDPSARATAEDICAMPYFKNTIAFGEYREPERPSNLLYKKDITKLPLLNNALELNIPSSTNPMKLFSKVYDDYDDGYENEFMKENVFEETPHLDDAPVELLEKENSIYIETYESPNLNTEDNPSKNSSTTDSVSFKEDSFESSDAKFSFSETAQYIHTAANQEYVWQPKQNEIISGSNSLMRDQLEEEYVIADTSYSSVQEINVN